MSVKELLVLVLVPFYVYLNNLLIRLKIVLVRHSLPGNLSYLYNYILFSVSLLPSLQHMH